MKQKLTESENHRYSITFVNKGWDCTVQEDAESEEEAIAKAVEKGKIKNPKKVVKVTDLGVPGSYWKENSKKNLVKEGAGAGYTVTIKDLKFGKILEKERIAGEKSYEDYWRLKVEVVPGDYEIAAEDYYNDFFWQEHEFGETPTAMIDGGVAIMEYPSNWDDEEEDLRKEVEPNVEDREMDVSFDYGWGWTHADLPREKIEADHVDVKDDYFYGCITKLELNAPDLVDAVNCGYQSIFDRDDEEEEDEENEEQVDESMIDDLPQIDPKAAAKLASGRSLDDYDDDFGDGEWHVFDYGEDYPYVERYVVVAPDGYEYFISHNGGAGAFDGDVMSATTPLEMCYSLAHEIDGKEYLPVEVSQREISANRKIQKGLKLIKAKYEYEDELDNDEEKKEIDESLGSKKNINLTFDEFNKLCDLIDMDWKRWNKSDPDNINIVANRALEHLEWVTSTKLGTNNPKDVRISFVVPSALPDDFSTGNKQSMTIYELIDNMCWSDNGKYYMESQKRNNMKWKKLMKESYDDEWASVGAAFEEFTQRLWRYTRQDRDNRIDAFQACTKTMEQAMRDYYNEVVANPES